MLFFLSYVLVTFNHYLNRFCQFCLGIGIDDMFVISNCWSNVEDDPSPTELSLSEKMGKTMKHAGVSITVTTLTDVFVFGIGATSVCESRVIFSINIKTLIPRKCQDFNLFVSALHSLFLQSIFFKSPSSLHA